MKFSAKGLAITLTISIIFSVCFLFFEMSKNAKILNNTLHLVEFRINETVEKSVRATDGLRIAQSLITGNLSQEEFQNAVKQSFEVKNISTLAYAPEGIITYTHPEKISLHGKSLITDEMLFPAMQRAIETGETALSVSFADKNTTGTIYAVTPLGGNTVSVSYIDPAIAIENSGAALLKSLGYEYQFSYAGEDESIVISNSENFGSKFRVSEELNLANAMWTLSIHMDGMGLFNVFSVLVFFLAIQGIGFVIIAPSQSEKKSREILYDITYKDSLTGAFNRKRLSRFFNARKLDNNAPFSMFYTDINSFVEINETYGRHTADEVLKEFTKRLDSYIRDAIIVRLDGDDFVVVITGSFSTDILDSIKARLDNAFSKPLVIKDVDIHISVAIAYSSFPKEGQSLEKLLAVCAERIIKIKKTVKK